MGRGVRAQQADKKDLSSSSLHPVLFGPLHGLHDACPPLGNPIVSTDAANSNRNLTQNSLSV